MAKTDKPKKPNQETETTGMTTDSSSNTHDLDDLDAEAIDIDTDEQPKAGPAPGSSDEPDQVQDIPTAELLKPLIGFAFQVFAPNWEVTPVQIVALADSYAAVIDKYFPDFDLGVEAQALFVTAAIIGPLIGTPRYKQPIKDVGGGEGEEVDNKEGQD